METGLPRCNYSKDSVGYTVSLMIEVCNGRGGNVLRLSIGTGDYVPALGSRLGCRLRCGHLDLVLEAAPEMWRVGSMGVDRSSRSRRGYLSFQSEVLIVVVMDCSGIPSE